MNPTPTPEELVALGKWLESDTPPKLEAFTCHDCEARTTCELAWDPYNLHGDCLASK